MKCHSGSAHAEAFDAGVYGALCWSCFWALTVWLKARRGGGR